MTVLSLSLLGPFQATLDDQPIVGLTSNKARALLSYLAVEADRPHSREALATLLWPERPEHVALSDLRCSLHHLRQAIGDHRADVPFLLITRNTIQFNARRDYRLDVTDFVDLLAAGRAVDQHAVDRWRQAAALYRGGFLEGFSAGDSTAFEDWMLFKREQHARQMLFVLNSLAAVHEQWGGYETAQSYVRRQIQLEPWHEEGHQQLMRLLALSGQRSAALAQYETCRRLLADELGVEPGKETRAQYESIRDGRLPDGRRRPPETDAPTGQAPANSDIGRAERPIIVGRKREMAELDRHLARALAGRGRVVFVTGDAGSGKSTLVSEFAERAARTHEHLVVVGGCCNPQLDAGAPFAPFWDIVQLLAGDLEPTQRQPGTGYIDHRRLRALLPCSLQTLVERGSGLIDNLVPANVLASGAHALAPNQTPSGAAWRARLIDLARRNGPASASAAIGQAEVFEQMTAVLCAIAERHPLMLILDDLQWADETSISLLFYLGRRAAGSRILIVGAYRPEDVALGREGLRHPLEAAANALRRTFGDIDVDLELAEGPQFVEDLLDAEPNILSADFREKLYRYAGGHALFTVELLRGFKARGDIVQDEAARWVEGESLDWERLPARVEAVIAERINRLPPVLQATLKIASVEGAEFTAEVVARVQGVDEQDVYRRLSGPLARLHRLVVAQALERVGGQRLSRYRFRHYLFQRYLYGRLDEVERAHRHEAVGNALEQLYGDHAGEIAARLAFHFEAADAPVRAADWLLRARR
ncbi:MAG: DUF2791 family P-loop domain-containing protein [Chloroflexi bacterium]|nr:DUF2791 family P-loop domain-containing protein [Chloroflexota bacterium]